MKIFVLHRNLVTTTKEIVILTLIAMDLIQLVLIMVVHLNLDFQVAQIAVMIHVNKIPTKQDKQDFVPQAAPVKLMKAIANLMINAYQVIHASLEVVLSVLAFPMQQAVVRMLVVVLLMWNLDCFSHRTTQITTRIT